jgi:hypothetical protein
MLVLIRTIREEKEKNKSFQIGKEKIKLYWKDNMM